MTHLQIETANLHDMKFAEPGDGVDMEITERRANKVKSTYIDRLLRVVLGYPKHDVPANSHILGATTEAPKLLAPSFSKQEICSSMLLRVIEYLYRYPGSETKSVAWSCQVADLPRLLRRVSNREILESWGLKAHCERKVSINGFGESLSTGHWYLLLVDEALFEQFLSRVSTK